MKKYSMGFDIGTNSAGWCVVDENNQLVKKNGKTLWGSRLFDEAQDASSRRLSRGSRIRLDRRNLRISWLREVFMDEINKVDSTFFERLDDSFYKLEDKRNGNYYNLFTDSYTDKDFFNEFPTIFHLRKYLIDSEKKEDIRFIYLAIANMVKYRGNFLTPGDVFNPNDNTAIKNVFKLYNELSVEMALQFEDDEEYFNQIDFDDNTYKKLSLIMLSEKTKNDKKKDLKELFNSASKSLISEYFIPLLLGSKCNLSKLLIVKENDYDKCEITVLTDKLEDEITDKKNLIPELDNLLDFLPNIKDVVDFYFLKRILKSSTSLSEAMIHKYNEHKKDLKQLKSFIRKYLPSRYNECFRTNMPDKLNNYVSYIGMNNVNKKMQRMKHCKREDFYSYINKLLSEVSDESALEFKQNVQIRMENNDYLLRQNSDQNGSIPMQLNLSEIKQILDKQKKFYPFLNVESTPGLTNIDKIISIFKYKVPYYIGHLNDSSDGSWVIRSHEKIYPWNFDKVVNVDATATEFIHRMQRKCTYLTAGNNYCLPKNSLVFSEYNCLSYLNKISINGSLIPVEIKNDIFKNVFLTIKSPTRKDLFNYIKANYGEDLIQSANMKDLPEINCNMSSYIKFKEIFGNDFDKNYDLIEQIIKDIVIFSDKKILEKRLIEIYKLEIGIVKKIKDLVYVGYSNLSNKLLNETVIHDSETGEIYGTVLNIMRNSNANLQQILYDPKYRLIDIIDDYNSKNSVTNDEQTIEEFIEENVSISPIMKRPMIQAYTIIEEVEKILGEKITDFYIECARTNKAKKKPTNTRYAFLKDLYKNSKSICKELGVDYNEINKKLDDNKNNLRSDMLYLYFTQLGKCMYSLNDIDLDDLLSNSKYDIDHIYPQSLLKDNSFNNRVLTLKSKNAAKKDKFIFEIENFLNPKCYAFYKFLKDAKLISVDKYDRLCRKEINPAELEGFVNRQIVATNQAVKGLITILKYYKKVDQKNIIYSKAENITEFRQDYNILKSRTANNFHHAHDAYLNVVIGRALNQYYTLHSFNGYKDYQRLKVEEVTINPSQILKYDRSFNGKVIWDKEKTIALLKNNIFNRFDVMETIRTFNSKILFNKISILPASTGNLVPVKSTGPLSDTSKYGGFTSPSYSRYVILKTNDSKNGNQYFLEAIPAIFDSKINEYLRSLDYKNFEVINDNIKSNVVIKNGSLKFCITGKTGNQYVIKNMNDRFFKYDKILTIRKIDKFNKNNTAKVEMQISHEEVVVSPEGKNGVSIVLTKQEVIDLINDLVDKYGKPIYAFNIIQTIKTSIINTNLFLFDLPKLVELATQLLLLLKTNERKSANLETIGLSPNSGVLLISKKLPAGLEFVSESITGYYKKILFKVPE